MKTWDQHTSLEELIEIRKRLLENNPKLQKLQDEIDIATENLDPIDKIGYLLSKSTDSLNKIKNLSEGLKDILKGSE